MGDLIAGEGQLAGNGRTELHSVSAPMLNTVLTGGHRLVLTGDYGGAVDLKLSGQSRFVNAGNLSASGSVRIDSGLPADLFYFPNTFTNLGTIQQAIAIGGLRFDNSRSRTTV